MQLEAKDVLTLVSTLSSIVVSVATLGWWLNSHFGKLEQRLVKIDGKLEQLDGAAAEAKEGLREARSGRAELHAKVDAVKERVHRLEVRQEVSP